MEKVRIGMTDSVFFMCREVDHITSFNLLVALSLTRTKIIGNYTMMPLIRIFYHYMVTSFKLAWSTCSNFSFFALRFFYQ